ncbi:alpha-1,3-arabinosyltransferase XAT3-like [Bidens hawaiensis]|uniref:alpha-1,3-arabinosyltransferase XAT3-like n=1 Tax=Bidens hawaiensis TaxID=980011 RepID=UPI004049A8C5
MQYHDIFARSFGQNDRKRLGYGALVNCLVITCCLCVVFKSYFSPPYVYIETKERTLFCNTTKRRSDTCHMTGDIRIHGTSSTIFVRTLNSMNSTWTIKPYARKGDNGAMQNITSYTIKTTHKETMPKCTKTHNIPAVVFSVGGYSGNHFHSFSDTIIPLYATTRKFNREARFLMANKNPLWTSKFQQVLTKLSKYDTIDIDHENDVHCFPSMIIGLEKHDHKELNTDSMTDFTKFLRASYSLKRSKAIKLTNGSTNKPRLLIVSRKRTRVFTNVGDVVNAARAMGFEVIVTEMSANLNQISQLVNSCDVMMGVHGAGLTNMVFMPENGVFIQVVPLGKMEWMAKTFYGDPAKGMGLSYLEYKVSKEESSLTHQYPANHLVFEDPYSIQRKGWEAYRSMYMDRQDVKLDVVRFKETLSKALELLR